ncbi:MAG: hypothetical protein JSV62_07225 [Promethearchaeota archaeon]|nr:MAG: hypothetical protein JSV62_07225 [Candidatus Lokiarchaeota archaeon]
MDITRFNKELANKITTAKRHEKSGDFKLAVKLWLEISEMAIKLSKNQELEASFRNMLMNRVKGIFEHIKILKSGGRVDKQYIEKVHSPQEIDYIDYSVEDIQSENVSLQAQESSEIMAESSNNGGNLKIIENDNLKNLPKGFKEIETSEDFEIITPHDKDFLKKQLDKALDSDYFKKGKEEGSRENSETQEKLDFEKPKDLNIRICFACGYDKNLIKDKSCRNCGTNLD